MVFFKCDPDCDWWVWLLLALGCLSLAIFIVVVIYCVHRNRRRERDEQSKYAGNGPNVEFGATGEGLPAAQSNNEVVVQPAARNLKMPASEG